MAGAWAVVRVGAGARTCLRLVLSLELELGAVVGVKSGAWMVLGLQQGFCFRLEWGLGLEWRCGLGNRAPGLGLGWIGSYGWNQI